MNIAIILIIIHWILFHYTFEFQRITLTLARQQDIENTKDYQIILTPTWMGILGWTLNIIHILAIILVYLYHGWIIAIIYAVLSYFGFYSFIGFYIHYPSKKHYFSIIKRHLLGEIKKGKIEITSIYQHIIEAEKTLKIWNNLFHF